MGDCECEGKFSIRGALALEGGSDFGMMLTFWQMLSYGVEEKWPPGMCGRKWRQLELANGAIYTTQSMTPVTTSQMSSPVDGAFVYPFLPIQ